ncbi:hypothetical protein WJX84_011548 [Apatococcus fuscideae]|uniref:Uncharacterized protein n=1 Tax=Apatococcus fuscideae TaxID=2026836 RepID=A0AAW1TDC2_9CHLO
MGQCVSIAHNVGQPAQGGGYRNPVIDRDFPDPFCCRFGRYYFAFATNANGSNVQCAVSDDLVQWRMMGDALPQMPPWANPGLTWAPNVSYVNFNGSYYHVLFFVARDRDSDKQAVGVATSQRPEGPYQPVSTKALINQVEEGGTIDPSCFVDDDGARVLIYKNDGNSMGKECWLYMRRLEADGVTLVGEEVRLFKNDMDWEGGVVEAPFMWKHDGRYYLFYSGNGYGGDRYAVGFATSTSLFGPYHKDPKPIMTSGHMHGRVTGPGACSLIMGPNDGTWMLYHSWSAGNAYRACSIAQLGWQGGRPTVTPSYGINCTSPSMCPPS